ncbi:hypothetical protein H920_06742 [Fukomys damarensis]|uniref:Uncharacterized protein n=1 Tax=Fukomys damarensis TaxID=885580 RepID=A0A091E9H0_FUKDA|nr:hypothetical protein H920_06742 [Fukomys damarensis]
MEEAGCPVRVQWLAIQKRAQGGQVNSDVATRRPRDNFEKPAESSGGCSGSLDTHGQKPRSPGAWATPENRPAPEGRAEPGLTTREPSTVGPSKPAPVPGKGTSTNTTWRGIREPQTEGAARTSSFLRLSLRDPLALQFVDIWFVSTLGSLRKPEAQALSGSQPAVRLRETPPNDWPPSGACAVAGISKPENSRSNERPSDFPSDIARGAAGVSRDTTNTIQRKRCQAASRLSGSEKRPPTTGRLVAPAQ